MGVPETPFDSDNGHLVNVSGRASTGFDRFLPSDKGCEDYAEGKEYHERDSRNHLVKAPRF